MIRRFIGQLTAANMARIDEVIKIRLGLIPI